MIVFDLICDKEHRFEGWFSSADDVERQRERGLLECPVCGSAKVAKLPSSKIKRAAEPAPAANLPAPSEAPGGQAALPTTAQRAQLMAMIEHVLQNTENVGGKFADEARKIHYKEAPERAIRGTASQEETRELLEEGIPVLPLPVPPPTEWH